MVINREVMVGQTVRLELIAEIDVASLINAANVEDTLWSCQKAVTVCECMLQQSQHTFMPLEVTVRGRNPRDGKDPLKRQGRKIP